MNQTQINQFDEAKSPSPSTSRITRADLDWWLNIAPTLDWAFAVTYADSAPHHYVVKDRTPELTPEDFVRAGRVIRTFGELGKFFKRTNLYLISPDGRYRWWGMDHDVADTGIINRADASHIYGPQNAPRTVNENGCGVDSSYDEFASYWDTTHAATDEERRDYSLLIRELIGNRPQRVLDIGCGTGLALDLGITTPERYVGVDPSRAMLNELVLKYPHTAGIHPVKFETVLQERFLCGTKYNAVLALGGSASYLTPEEIYGIPDHASGPIVLAHYATDLEPIANDLDASTRAASFSATQQLVEARGGRSINIGRFIVSIF
ncbi:hypothetical protein JOF28_001074 [Leucobacter exalbidus]|uniref:Methyltransferase domain-containing protein n=1 Tax=Leucobacter exalbidus TaxID=662960 RepID=A0A940PSA7_9MICO|nr:class I SAM-dependent methyltransferase [Leucobacter exalbidus]MBP1325842.1 hypothetical protein [Leucobacter exalbidus]